MTVQSLPFFPGNILCADDNHRDVFCARIQLEFFYKTESIDSRHGQIRDDEIRQFLPRHGESLPTVLGMINAIRFASLEQAADEQSIIRIIVDQQNSCGFLIQVFESSL